MSKDRDIIGDRVRLMSIDAMAVDRGYFDWMQDDAVIEFLEVRFGDRSREALLEFIERTNAAADQSLFAICTLHDDQYIGNIKLTFVRPHRRAEIGLLIGPAEVRGKGYGTEAIRLAGQHAFARHDMLKVTAGCYATNHASIRAFERAGFQIEAIRPSHYETDEGRVDGVYLSLWRDESNQRKTDY